MADIWNEVVDDGVAFPQPEGQDKDTAAVFFSQQSFTGVAAEQGTGEVLGLYILHPNNTGRCGHIANASYAVKSAARGLGVGGKLVCHSLEQGKRLGFRLLQFNAVVKTNRNAIHLYEKLGFVRIGEIPGGFLMKDGTYEDILLFYHIL
jgi:ribosomal protein S18 acetylase RimI-like enzyme